MYKKNTWTYIYLERERELYVYIMYYMESWTGQEISFAIQRKLFLSLSAVVAY